MKKRTSLFLIVVLSIFIAFSCNKKETVNYEGQVMLYTTLDDDVAMEIKNSFEKEYPGVTLDYYYGNAERVKRKIEVEFDSGQPNADVVFINDFFALEDMKSKSMLEAYESKESKKISKEFKEKNNFYCAASLISMGIAFNQSADYGISDDEAPKKWNDFLNNTYKDKIALANPLEDSYTKYWVMAMMQNVNYRDAYFRRLRDYGTVIASGGTNAMDRIVSGKCLVGFCSDEKSINYMNEYEDYKFRYAESDNVTMISGIGLVKGSANQDNGKLLIDFMLSKKGQELLVAKGLVSARSDVKNKLNTNKVISSNMKIDIDDIVTHGNEYIRLFLDIFGD